MTVTNILIWQPYLFSHIYNHSGIPCLADMFFFVFMPIIFETAHIYVSIQNAHAYELLSDSHNIFYRIAIFLSFTHTYACMYTYIYYINTYVNHSNIHKYIEPYIHMCL